MFEYKAHKDLFDFLNLEKNPKMHWTHNFSWAMAQHMHGIILEVTKSIVGIAQYLSFYFVMRKVQLTTTIGCQFMFMWFKIGCEY
jgi:hypothetical protein